MKKLFGLTLVALILACDPIPTTLVVTKAFTGLVKNNTPPPCDYGCDTETKIQIPAGKYNSKLEFVSKRELILSIDVGRSRYNLSLNVPNNASIPNDNGSFVLSSRDSGQPFDLAGTLETTYSRTQEQGAYESCRYVIQEQQCWFDGRQNVCRWVQREVWGHQQVAYFLETANRHIVGTVANAKDAKDVFASFDGQRSETQKIYTYKGACY
jgi:hypothetical protein